MIVNSGTRLRTYEVLNPRRPSSLIWIRLTSVPVSLVSSGGVDNLATGNIKWIESK